MGIVLQEIWRGIPVIRLQVADYMVRVCPKMGGNVLDFAQTRLSAHALRMPPDAETFYATPNVYGIPPLFPPNRICDGQYRFQDRTYTFPINEPARHNFLHGVLSQTPMTVTALDAESVYLSLHYAATYDHPYLTFPHAFTVDMQYALNEREGLCQTVRVRNESTQDMPFGFGFHTSFQTPPCADGSCRIFVPVGRECLLERTRIRPTGAYVKDTALAQALCGTGLAPQAQKVSHLFESAPGCVEVRDDTHGVSVRYEVDAGFRFWMLWNQDASGEFFCIEPQTWTVDAPNSLLPPEQSGMDAISPGDARTLTTRLRIE